MWNCVVVAVVARCYMQSFTISHVLIGKSILNAMTCRTFTCGFAKSFLSAVAVILRPFFFVRYQTLLFLLLERVFFHYFNFFTLNCHESSYYIHFTWIFFFFSSLTFCVFAHCREVFTAVSGYISLSMQQLHESISRYVCECQQRKMNMRTNYQLTEYNAIYGKNAFSIFNFLRWRFPLRFSLASFSPHSSCPQSAHGIAFFVPLSLLSCVFSAWVSFTFDSSFNRTTCCAADAECSFLYFMYYIYYDDDFLCLRFSHCRMCINFHFSTRLKI